MPSKRPRVTGVKNLGNTCFLNAVLQVERNTLLSCSMSISRVPVDMATALTGLSIMFGDYELLAACHFIGTSPGHSLDKRCTMLPRKPGMPVTAIQKHQSEAYHECHPVRDRDLLREATPACVQRSCWRPSNSQTAIVCI